MTKLKNNRVLCHVHSNFFSLVAKHGINILYSTESFCFSVTSWNDTMTLQRLILFTAEEHAKRKLAKYSAKNVGFFLVQLAKPKVTSFGE